MSPRTAVSDAYRNRSRASTFSRFGLFLCYLAFPAGAMLCRAAGIDYPREWIDAVWGVLLLVQSGLLLRGAGSLRGPSAAIVAIAIALGTEAALKLTYAAVMGMRIDPLALALETKPLVYLLVAGMMMAFCARPTAGDWVFFGKALALLIVSDTCVLSIAERSFARPIGSGEVNYDAFLLALALGAAVADRREERRRFRRFDILLIGVALLLTQSRTGLFAGMVAYFICSHTAPYKKMIALAIGITGALLFFLLRGLQADVDSLDRYWMWVAGVSTLGTPSVFWFGSTPGRPIPSQIPEAVATLWEAQTERLTIPGVYPFNLHAFWLRVAVSYGAPVSVLILVFAIVFSLRARKTRSFRYVAMLAGISGFTMGLFYLSNVSIPLLLALGGAATDKGHAGLPEQLRSRAS